MPSGVCGENGGLIPDFLEHHPALLEFTRLLACRAHELLTRDRFSA